jgi:hypothetical protein
MRNGINHTLTSSSSFALGGPGKNIQTVGVEIGILEMHCTCRIFWLAWGVDTPAGPESVREQDGRRHCWKQMARGAEFERSFGKLWK